MTTKKLVPRASGEGAMGVTDNVWGEAYYDTGNFNKGLFLSGHNITQVIAETVTQGGLGGEWTKAVNGLDIYYNGGNVGIGIAAPGARLSVENGSATIPSAKFNNLAGDADSTVHIVESETSSDHFGLFVGNNDTNGAKLTAVLLTKYRNVGIGAINPAGKLHVSDLSESIGNVDVIQGSNQITGTGLNTKLINGDKIRINTSTFTVSSVTPTTLTLSSNWPNATINGVEAFKNKELFIVKNNGNVGIGTADPGSKLVVQGDNEDIFLKSADGTGSVSLIQDLNGYGKLDVMNNVGNVICHFDSNGSSYVKNGNVGIGTADPSVNLETQKNHDGASQPLLVSNYDSTFNSVIATSSIAFGLARNGASAGLQGSQISDIGLITVGKSNIWDADDQNLKSYMAFSTADGLKIPPLVTPIERMRIDSAGNVGIGTANPDGPLHVSSVNPNTINLTRKIDILTNLGASSIIRGGALAGAASTYGGSIGFASENGGGGNTSGYLYFETKDNGASLTEKMRITSAGNVGIGIGINVAPAAKLDILKGGGAQYDVVNDIFRSGPEHVFKLSTGGWRNASVINQQTGSATAGLTLASYGLYLNTTYGSKLFASASVHVNCNTGNGDISFLTGTGDVAPTTKFRLQSNGNVGIGTTSPGTNKLYVNGNIFASGTITPTSDDRVKHNEQTIVGAIEILGKLTPKKYIKTTEMYDADHDFELDANGDPVDENGEPVAHAIEAGVIAQKVLEVPELAFTVSPEGVDEDGNVTSPHGLNYNSLFTYAIAAIQEQQQLIEDLRSEVEALKNK